MDRPAGQDNGMKIPLSRLKMPYSVRGYAHFDHRVSLASCYDLVSDPQWVARHSFYPFIGKEVRRIKWREGVPHRDPRPIRYAAHLDRCIYQYYTALLNDLYNIRAYNAGIDGVSIAYRTNHAGMSNCNYAREAFFVYTRARGMLGLRGRLQELFRNAGSWLSQKNDAIII